MSKKTAPAKKTASQSSMESRKRRLEQMTDEERKAWNEYQTTKSKESYRKRLILKQFKEMGVL